MDAPIDDVTAPLMLRDSEYRWFVEPVQVGSIRGARVTIQLPNSTVVIPFMDEQNANALADTLRGCFTGLVVARQP